MDEKIELRLSCVVVRRQPDVVEARPRGERVHGLVEPPVLGGEAEGGEDLALDVLLASMGKSPVRNESSTASARSAISAMSGTSPAFSSSNTARTSAVFIPGSKSSSRMS